MSTVNEKSTAYLTVSFYDKDNNLATPSEAFWQVHDVESGTILLISTSIAPLSSSVELTLTPAMNTLVDITNKEETRRVTVSATGTNYMVNAEYDYDVLNLSWI